jgi:hypothetical protein
MADVVAPPGDWADLYVNFQWQWKNDTQDDQYSVSKATGEPIYEDNNLSALSVLGWASPGKDHAIKTICQGQRHNPHVQDLYRKCVAQDPVIFWKTFAGASYVTAINWSEVLANLIWERDDNLGSIRDARGEWAAYCFTASTHQQLLQHLLRAHYLLLTGQRHNQSVMSQYRTAFRQEYSRLFALVRSI